MSRVVLHRRAVNKTIDSRAVFQQDCKKLSIGWFVWNFTFLSSCVRACVCVKSPWDEYSCMGSCSLWEEACKEYVKIKKNTTPKIQRNKQNLKKQNKKTPLKKQTTPPMQKTPQTQKPERTCFLFFKMQAMLWVLTFLSDHLLVEWKDFILFTPHLDLIKCEYHTLLIRFLNACQLTCDYSHWFGGLLGQQNQGKANTHLEEYNNTVKLCVTRWGCVLPPRE